LQTRFEAMGGYSIRSRAEAALTSLGFAPDTHRQPFDSFSGGWQMRAELVRVLLPEPDVLLLDEPSNYLDIPAVEWLQKQLREYRGTLALISHDRFLLNSLTTVTLEMLQGRVTRYSGNYDYYVAERQRRTERLHAAQMEKAEKIEKAQRFIEKFRAKNTRATQVQSRIKMLERMEPVEAPVEYRSRGRIRLPAPPHCGQEVIRLEEVGYSYDGQHWVLRGVNVQVQRGEKVALVGLNGTGKTTLLRLLVGALQPGEGRRLLGHRVTVGYQSQEFADTMDSSLTVFDTVRQVASSLTDEGVRTLLGGFGFTGENVEKRVQVLSGGEKVRLAFARLLAHPPNLLLLDEPTTHLDLAAREALEQALADYGGTVCLVSHDIEFVRHVATSILAMTPPAVTRYCGGYDYYHEKTSAPAVAEKPAPARTPTRPSARPAAAAAAAGGAGREAALPRGYVQRRRDLKRLVERLEKSVERYEEQRATLLQTIESGDPALDYARLSRQLTDVESEIARATRDWETLALEIERLDGSVRGDSADAPAPGPAPEPGIVVDTQN
jgi:ATP-binding cassette subfamily F protein 3